MKSRMLSKEAMDKLFHHILDGFKASHEGIVQLQRDHVMSDEEIHELIKKNSERLIDRIREFRLTEKLLSVFFALLFGYMQVTGDDLQMRKPAGARTSARTARSGSRSGRRRADND